jgi:hypothetical protein
MGTPWSLRAVVVWNCLWLAGAGALLAAGQTVLGGVVLAAALISTTLMLGVARAAARRRAFLAEEAPDALLTFPVMVVATTAPVVGVPAPPAGTTGVRVTMVLRSTGISVLDAARPVVHAELPWSELVGAATGADVADGEVVERLDLTLADGRDVVFYSAPDTPLRFQEAALAARPASDAWSVTPVESAPWERPGE